MKLIIVFAVISVALGATFSKWFTRSRQFNFATESVYSAADKLNEIWSVLMKDTSPAPWFSVFELLGLFTEDMNVSFDNNADWIPNGRKKLIHSQGVVGKTRWVSVGDHEYTGLFNGADFGIIRFSLAKEPPTEQTPGSITAPGMGIKFFRKGVKSANFVAMYSVEGQEGWNFFENTFSNHIGAAQSVPLKLLAAKFRTASHWETMVGLSDFAAYDQEGAKYPQPNFPFRLYLVPNPEVKKHVGVLVPGVNGKTWYKQFSGVAKDAHLYDVYAVAEPTNFVDMTPRGQLIAKIYLDGELSTSKIADRDLFFQHQRMEDDVKIKGWKLQ